MSSIPKAKYSQITELKVHPNGWDSHPNVERSTIKNCYFRNLSSGTKIERSTLDGVAIMSERPVAEKTSSDNDTSYIERSTLKDSEIHASHIERSDLKDSRTTFAKIERSTLAQVKISGLPEKRKAYVERSQLASSELCSPCSLSRCTTKDSVIEDAKMDRSTVKKSFVTGAKLERATLEDCDIENCEIKSSNFKGKFLRNGKWDKGNLVGRLDDTKEVVMRDMEAGREPHPEPYVQREIPGDEALPGYSTATNAPRDMHLFINQDPMPSRDAKTAFVDDDEESLRTMDGYNGPRIQTPPPYEE